jgi:predicted TIM-barrel fold metal-dependent hydrolase
MTDLKAGRIDVHCHSMTPAYRDAIYSLSPIIRTPEWSPRLTVDYMDRQGTAAAVLSLSVPGTHHGDDERARALARRCNEEAAEYVARHPKRLGAFATLPIPDIQGACEEARHALDVLKLDGIGLLASYDGKYLGDPSWDPLLDVLNQRSAVVVIHPNNHPSTQVVKQGISGGIGNFLVEFLFDTTRCALNLVFNDALHRFPNIRFVLFHAGGTLPYTAWRVSEIASRQMTESPWDKQYPSPFMTRFGSKLTQDDVLAQFKLFYYETALSAGPQTFGSLKAVAAPERILFGSDWPYCPEIMTSDMVKALTTRNGLDDQELHAIGRGNALRLFPRFA